MKFRKQAFSLFLMFIISFTCFTGCNTVSNKGKDITLTVYDQNSSFSGILTGWFADEIYNRFNVHLDFRGANDMAFMAYLEEGTLGDLIIFSNVSSYRSAKKAGVLYNFNDDDILNDYGHYLSVNVANALDKNRLLNDDNNIYGIFGDVSSSTADHSSFENVSYIRWDLYSALGYPDISTLEDFTDVLESMTNAEREATNNNNIYAVSTFKSWDTDMLDCIASTAGMYGYIPFGIGLYNPDTDSYEECLDDNGIYIRCLKFYNTLYRKGLLDPDSCTQSYEDARKNYKKGLALFGMYEVLTADAYNTSDNLADGKSMMPIVAEDFSNLCTQNNTYGVSSIWSIGSKSTYPDICMEIINWLYTSSGVLTSHLGPENVTWAYDESGNPYITDFGFECLSNPQLEMPETYTGTYLDGLQNFETVSWSITSAIPNTNMTYNYLTWDSTINSDWYKNKFNGYSVAQSDWCSFTKCTSMNQYIEQNGYTEWIASDYTMSETPMDYQIMLNTIKESIKNYSWLAIYCKTDEDFNKAIHDMQNDCYARKYDEIMDFYISELNAYKFSLK